MKSKSKYFLYLLFCIPLLFLPIFSCGKAEQAPVKEEVQETVVEKEEPAPEPEAEMPVGESTAETETEDLAPVEMPEISQGMITFYSGDVYIYQDDDWWEVEIGDFLEENDMLKTEADSYCEIQFGDTAVVRVQENTEIAMRTIYLSADEANINVDMDFGGVLCKVQKLTGNEQFKVKTQTAVCGVRGTEFSVKSSKDKKTVLAVKEGAVAVLPSNVNVEELKEKVEDKGEEVLNIIKEIENAATVVSADQEINVDEETLKESEEAAIAISEAVEEIAKSEEPEVGQEKIDRLTKVVEEKKQEVAQKVEPAKEISKENTDELKQIDKMKLLEIPVAEKGEKGEDKAEPVKINLVKISLSVNPPNADILLNGESVGKGKYSGIFTEGERLVFSISQKGYLDHSFSIQTAAESAKLYKIALKKIPVEQEINLKVSPNDAAIVLDGETMGIGTFRQTFEVGKKLAFTIRKEGYIEQNLNIEVKENTDNNYEVALQQIKEKITLDAEPRNAEIIVNGKLEGRGSYTGQFPPGEIVTFLVRSDGYEEETLEAVVKKGETKPIKVSLKKLMRGIQISTSPADASIILQGREVGKGSYSGTYEQGRQLNFRITRDGYEPETLSVTVTSQVKTYEVSLKPKLYTFQLRTDPSDASITLKGRVVGKGSYTAKYQKGENLNFTISSEGYETETAQYRVSDNERPVTVSLTKKPIAARFSVSKAKIVGDTAAGGNLIFSVDKTGFLAAANTKGTVLWNISTKNNPNENSYPVLINSNVYFSGARELVIAEQRGGKVIGRIPLSGESAHLFGRRVVQLGNDVLLPANETIKVINASTGEVKREIPIPKGSRMTPAVWKDKLVIVDQQGSVLIINPAGKSAVEAEISTSAVQPVALSLTLLGDLAFFSGRKGTVVCVDLAKKSVRWERDLASTVFNDIICGTAGAYVYSKGQIFGLSITDGKNLFSPIPGVTSPPLLDGNSLYYGTQKEFISANAVNGSIKKKTYVGNAVTSRPVRIGSTIAAGTDRGEMIIFNP